MAMKSNEADDASLFCPCEVSISERIDVVKMTLI